MEYVRLFEKIALGDIADVGGKNASLGEMIGSLAKAGVAVPPGFATTSAAYRYFVEKNNLAEKVREQLSLYEQDKLPLHKAGRAIRRLFLHAEFPDDLRDAIVAAYDQLCDVEGVGELDVAVRSSATAEDLPEASFAGQQETFLNINGERELLDACRKCYASLFTDRAIVYRIHNGFDHMSVALSIGVQKMVRSDLSGAGVMFTIDTENGFPGCVVITAAWGLGENVVQGAVTPDEYRVFKPLLDDTKLRPIIQKDLGAKEKKMIYAKGRSATTRNIDTTVREQNQYVLDDDDILKLGRWAKTIEDHYGKAMDIEWAKDGLSGDLYIVQARPETVQSQKKGTVFTTYNLLESGEEFVAGIAIGERIVTGTAQVIRHVSDIGKFKPGSILVTETTDPDWVPIMKKAAGIITDYGGRTSHAAIISRELEIPAIVGTHDATHAVPDHAEITMACTGTNGIVYKGALKFETIEHDMQEIPDTKTQVKMNLASPESAFHWWRLPADGIGLARMEFIVGNYIKAHPMALVKYPNLADKKALKEIEQLTVGYHDKGEYFVDKLALGIARIAASQYPRQIILRMSDFKTNEYAELIGGHEFEPSEENPMIGFRGASRYYSDAYREGFALECRAVKKVREEMGLSNVDIMIPFCRTLEEADRVLDELKKNGIPRGAGGLKVLVMCEIPSNVILASEFAERFDGFSIGSNDLTQLTLGVDRDSAELAYLFDERNDAIKASIRSVVEKAHAAGSTVGICGQAPSDHPDFAEFLVEAGVDSMSLTPDRVIETRKLVADVEKKLAGLPPRLSRAKSRGRQG